MGLKVIANDDNDFCHAFYSSGSGSDLYSNFIPRIDNKLIDW